MWFSGKRAAFFLYIFPFAIGSCSTEPLDSSGEKVFGGIIGDFIPPKFFTAPSKSPSLKSPSIHQGAPSFLYSALLFTTLLFSSLLYSTLLFTTLLFSSLLFSTFLFSSLLCSSLHYSTFLLSSLLYWADAPKTLAMCI